MTPASCEQLRGEVLLVYGIRRVAFKYFGHTENAKDAESEAWVKILESPGNMLEVDYLNVARKAIRAAYMRHWRKRKPTFLRKT